MPHSGLDAWMQLSDDERKSQEQEMQTQWNAWLEEHKSTIVETAGVGKPKRVTANGIEDARNDIMMYSFVEAESLKRQQRYLKIILTSVFLVVGLK